MTRMRTAIAVIGIAASAVLTACASSDEDAANGSKTKVAMIQIGNYEYAQTAFAGAEAAAEADGTAEVAFYDGGFDPQAQLQRCKDVVASGDVDAIVLMPVSATGILPCITQAAAQKIPVVGLSTPVGPDPDSTELQVAGVVSQVLVTPSDDAVATAEMVTQACEGKTTCGVVIGVGDPAVAYPAAKLQATKDSLAGNPDIEILGTPTIGYADAAKGYASGRDILTAYPEVDVIVADTDATMRGIERAVDEDGQIGEIALIGDGGSQYAWDAIKAGRWFGSGYYTPRTEGEKATELAIAAARGEKVEPYVPSASLNTLNTLLLTKATLDDLEPQYKGS